ncbi:MAG: hypothetical protein HY505_00645 [Candidatus Yanofskybacteria bacterium]|nr:hypothetical protein [Candidatus Yanofskybacteria bacterium]
MELPESALSAVVCRGGPDNLFFCAQAVCTSRKILRLNGHDIAGIYAVSGPDPVAVLGCIGKEKKLCDILLRLTPQDIVGDMDDLKSVKHLSEAIDMLLHLKKANVPVWRTVWRALVQERKELFRDLGKTKELLEKIKLGHIIDNKVLGALLIKHARPYLDRIFGSDAILMKIGATDFLTGQQVIFSNKIPEHKDWLFPAILGSMGLVPQFPAITIDHPKELKLVDKTHPDFDNLLLIDGGYSTGLLVDEAIREPIGYDVIFIIDINGVQVSDFDINTSYNILTRILRALSIRSTTHDRLILSIQDRIDEEISIKNKIVVAREKLAEAKKLSHRPEDLDAILKLLDYVLNNMNYGRLRLHDKHAPQRVMISNPEQVIPFDFTNFTQTQAAHLMRAGHNAALKTLRELGLNTKGIPFICTDGDCRQAIQILNHTR